MTSRRKFISLGAIGTGLLGLGIVTHQRGLRIPPFVLEPKAPAEHKVSAKLEIRLENSIFVPSNDKTIDHSLRAYTPEPIIEIKSFSPTKCRLIVGNLLPEAVLVRDGNSIISEHIDGIKRVIELDIPAEQTVTLRWQLAELSEYKFAAIGDTGGMQELAWCVQRAHDLGAKFLLHLGDINYTHGDFESAAEIFRTAPLPIYVSIGNHDFHDNGPKYQFFLNNFGPLNYEFSVGKVRFVNIDTASDFIPYGSGHRGRLFKQLNQGVKNFTTIAFTHRPLYDPLEDSDHHIGSEGERNWLIESLPKGKYKDITKRAPSYFGPRND